MMVYKQPLNIPVIICKNNKNDIIYAGMTKRRIEEWLKEHIHYLKYNNQKTTLARKNTEIPIKINTVDIKRITNYNCLHNTLIREAIEITLLKEENEKKLSNEMTHTIIDNR